LAVGVDVHRLEHFAAAVDELGRRVDRLTFATTAKGHERFIAWLGALPSDHVLVGIENAGGYGITLTVALSRVGLVALDVPPWRTVPHRRALGPGKADLGDAESIARVVRAGADRRGAALRPELVRAVARLEAARRQEVRDRTKTIPRPRAVWATVDPAAEAASSKRNSARQLQRLRRVTFPGGGVAQTAQRCVRDLAARVAEHNRRITALEHDIAHRLAEHGNPLEGVIGGGPIVAAQLVAPAGAVRRFRDAAAVAADCRTSPIPCGSGTTSGRHRLNPAANRQLNTAIHRTALTRARRDPRARTYPARKNAEGKTDREARRALKRHLTNVVYRRLNDRSNRALLT
jgi:transposase